MNNTMNIIVQVLDVVGALPQGFQEAHGVTNNVQKNLMIILAHVTFGTKF